MNKLTAIAIITLVLLTAPIFAEYSGGSGTAVVPWQISCPNDLLYLGSHTADYSSHFILTADINLTGYTFTTALIAPDVNNVSSGFQGTAFTGTFNGDGFVIHNLTIDTNGIGNDYLGLFGIGCGCEIRNLGIEDVNITSGDGSWSIGGLVGSNYAFGEIINCYSTGAVSGGIESEGIGGLVGDSYMGKTIIDCYSTATVTGGDGSSYLGGLTGIGDGINCFATGAVTSGNDSQYLGGLIGIGSCSNCYSTGAVTSGNGSQYLGGLIGIGSGSNCYSTGAVIGGSNSEYIGGLVGANNHHNINNCYASGAVDGNSFVGGLVGRNYEASVSNCYATGRVTGGDESQYIGGLVGENHSSTINNCYASGAVDGNSFVGGLVGRNNYIASVVSNCYAKGEVTGVNYLGGLIGCNNHGTIRNCYANGAVDGNSSVGGLVGGNEGRVNVCYATGAVTGGEYFGGLVGEIIGGWAIDGFWDAETSGLTDGVGNWEPDPESVKGKTTTEMQTKSTFTKYSWDFVGESQNGTEDIWRMCVDGVNYPLLNWQFINGRGDFVCPDGVDFADYAVLANAWLATPADANWNSLCDLQPDNVIDILDLQILIDNWLEGL